MEIKSRKNAAAAALCTGVAGNVIWGSSYLFTRIAQNESSPMVQLAWRFVLAFLLLNLMILFGWEKLRLRGKKLRPLLLLSELFLQPAKSFSGCDGDNDLLRPYRIFDLPDN